MSFVQLQIEPDLLLITQLEYGVKNYNDKNYVLLLSLLCQQPIQSIHQSSKPWILHREKYPQHFKIKPEHLLFNYLNRDEQNQDELGHGPSSLQFFVYPILNIFSFSMIQFATPLFLEAAAEGRIKCIQMLVSHISLLPAKANTI